MSKDVKKFEINLKRDNNNTPQNSSAASRIDESKPIDNQPQVNTQTANKNIDDRHDNHVAGPQLNLLDGEAKSGGRWIMIFSIIVGILLICAGYILFKYFNTPQARTQDVPLVASVQNQQERLEDSSGIAIENLDYEGIVSGRDYTGIAPEIKGNTSKDSTITKANDTKVTPTVTPTVKPSQPAESLSKSVIKPAVSSVNKSVSAGGWTANHYKYGDIKGATYKVTSGDTLWEIAVAHYGNGHDWVKIAHANNIHNLANGNPLITSGMNLTLP